MIHITSRFEPTLLRGARYTLRSELNLTEPENRISPVISPVNQNPWISPVITVSKKTMEITEHITGDLRKGQVWTRTSHARTKTRRVG